MILSRTNARATGTLISYQRRKSNRRFDGNIPAVSTASSQPASCPSAARTPRTNVTEDTVKEYTHVVDGDDQVFGCPRDRIHDCPGALESAPYIGRGVRRTEL